MDCPSCGYVMKRVRADQVELHTCDLCGGLWVATLQSLQLWATFHSARTPLPATPPDDVPTLADHCPTCAVPLETFPYMEDRTVELQRCNRCSHLFVPGPMQEGARALWAKRVGREAVRLERTTEVVAAYQLKRGVVGRTRSGRPILREVVDREALATMVRNERGRGREGDD